MDRGRPQLAVAPPASGAVHEHRPALALTSTRRLYREHAGFVSSVAFRLLGRSDELDDVVQDVFLAAFRGIAALRDPDAVRPWLAAVTVRLARRRLRVLKLRRWCGFDDAPEYEDVSAPGATPEDRALLAQIYRILDALPVDQRIAWCLRHVHGDTLEVVASATGCSLATAKRRISAAHAALEEAVAHHG